MSVVSLFFTDPVLSEIKASTWFSTKCQIVSFVGATTGEFKRENKLVQIVSSTMTHLSRRLGEGATNAQIGNQGGSCHCQETGELRGGWGILFCLSVFISPALSSQGYELSKIGMLLMLLIFPLLSDMSLFAASKSWVYKDFYFKVLIGRRQADRCCTRREPAGRRKRRDTQRVRQGSYLLILLKLCNKET